MGIDLNRIESEIAPLLQVHGVELVALEWLQGPGHGILRVFIDRRGGDPRIQDPARSVTLEEVTNVTRDVSSALDALDLIEGSYTLELGSPGPDRPVQKREDFNRFAGLAIRIDAREGFAGKGAFRGTLRGTVDHPEGGFAVRVEVGTRIYDIPAARVARARLQPIKPPPKHKPGKGPSRRQERLAAREAARAVNAAHLAARAAERDGAADEAAPPRSPKTDAPSHDQSQTSSPGNPREAKR